MKCPNCKKETHTTTTFILKGKKLTFCRKCPRQITTNRAPAFLKSRSKDISPLPLIQNTKTGRIPDIVKRKMDDVDFRKNCMTVFSHGRSQGEKTGRSRLVDNKFSKRFGHGNYTIVKDDGFEVVAKAKDVAN